MFSLHVSECLICPCSLRVLVSVLYVRLQVLVSVLCVQFNLHVLVSVLCVQFSCVGECLMCSVYMCW